MTTALHFKANIMRVGPKAALTSDSHAKSPNSTRIHLKINCIIVRFKNDYSLNTV